MLNHLRTFIRRQDHLPAEVANEKPVLCLSFSLTSLSMWNQEAALLVLCQISATKLRLKFSLQAWFGRAVLPDEIVQAFVVSAVDPFFVPVVVHLRRWYLPTEFGVHRKGKLRTPLYHYIRELVRLF